MIDDQQLTITSDTKEEIKSDNPRLAHAFKAMASEEIQAKRAALIAEHNKRRCAYVKKRSKNDPAFRMAQSIRGRARAALNGNEKHARSVCGCSAAQLRAHIEKQFTEGMTWKNYGEWQVDHITPCRVYDLSDPEHQRMCFHFLNLRPLWRRANMAKGGKILVELYN